jgi:hypothetical protein
MYLEQARQLDSVHVASLLQLVRCVDIAPGPGGSRITPLGPSGAEFAKAAVVGLPLWPRVVETVTASVVALYPSSQIVAHRDPPIAGTRYHIPLVVNDGCWVFHGGTWQQLDVEKVYAMDPTEVHGAVNWGTEVRLHLMVDVHA